MAQSLQLSDHFTYRKLLRFTLPSMLMMVFISLYAVVDGLFVSNFCKEEIFTAVNLIWPWPMLLSAFGFMFGSGGVALVGKTLGEGDRDKANRYFSFVTLITLLVGIVLAVFSVVFIRQIATMLGATGDLIEYCVIYGTFLSTSIPFFMLQNLFQTFFVAAEKPRLGFAITIIAGFTNIIGDALFVAVFNGGLIGAASASVLSQIVGAIIPLLYFHSKKNHSLLKFVKPRMEFKVFLKVITNGSSELLTNISVSLLNILYNYQLLKYIPDIGVAAYGVSQYVCFIFMAIFFGYNMGVGPLISYNFGAKNKEELSNVVRKSFLLVAIFGVSMTILGVCLARGLAYLYVGYNKDIYDLTTHGFRLYSLAFMILGFNVFTSALFTSLNNGGISLAISFGRTLVFQIIVLFLLPAIFGADAIWLVLFVSELLAIFLSIGFIIGKQKKYKY